ELGRAIEQIVLYPVARSQAVAHEADAKAVLIELLARIPAPHVAGTERLVGSRRGACCPAERTQGGNEPLGARIPGRRQLHGTSPIFRCYRPNGTLAVPFRRSLRIARTLRSERRIALSARRTAASRSRATAAPACRRPPCPSGRGR